MKRKQHRIVLVVMPTGDYAERLKLEGILQYAQERTGSKWELDLDIGGVVGRLIRGESKVDYDGIIAYIQSDEERRSILRIGLPTVLIEDLQLPQTPVRRKRVVSILCDHSAEGATAAEYFLSRHYQNFAFVGTERRTNWSDLRRDGFISTLGVSGRSCLVYDGTVTLEAWLKDLPKPCALLAVRDLRARQVLAAASNVGIAIPQDLAVLGVDNDEILCRTCAPELSSIPTFDRSLGYAAGRALNQLFTRRTSGGVISTRHSQVLSRHSTDADALSDPFVARALKWARTHLDGDLSAANIAEAIGYSRKSLVARTGQALGITLSEAIRHERIKAAKELLVNTQLPIAAIAEKCGFSNVSHLSLRIRESTGLTPLAYRRSSRG